VAGTLFDLRQLARLGDRLSKVPLGKGYFNNFCVTDADGSLKLIARYVKVKLSVI
jgi:hypothetical protein